MGSRGKMENIDERIECVIEDLKESLEVLNRTPEITSLPFTKTEIENLLILFLDIAREQNG